VQNVVFQALVKAAASREPVALGILTAVKGSSPQKLGAKAVFHQDGQIDGTLGGGCLEAEIQQRALESLRTGKPGTFELVLDHDFGWDDGLICGGKVSGVILPNAGVQGAALWSSLAARQETQGWGVQPDYSIHLYREGEVVDSWRYHEKVAPPSPLWIAGAGHIAQAVAPLAAEVDFAVSVFDDRPALLNRRFFPGDTVLRAGDWDAMLAEALPPITSFGLIVTRGHRHDAWVLREWIRKPFAFLGMIGSRRKARTIFEHFLEERIATPEQLARVASPVGLPIEARSVQEIAVSIVAQLIEKRARHRREELTVR
jgi:xanthine dehydrogenase accessory factor